jgi:hypothetical protein
MINQIALISRKTSTLPGINKGLIQARHIQAKLKDRAGDDNKPDRGILWRTDIAAPCVVPILRWIE